MKAPLKTVLKNFLDHVEDLDNRRKVYDDQYELEFQELKKLTDKLKEDLAFTSSVGLKDVNRPKNRYKDIVPYDFSRVILPKHEGVPGSDYINASYIKGASGAFAYIAAQGPLPNTVIDFWRMIWVCDVQVIVMACNEKEAGKFKCEAYWPGPGEIKNFGNISIELIDTSQVCPDFLIRTFLVKCDSEMRDVYQFHYTSWPDHGVPDAVQPILDLVRLMRDRQASETVPIVVHCSAGCGRTGTICAVDYVWACLRHGKLDEDFSLYQIALELRRQRIAMIQTKEQYILAHRAVAAMFEQQLKVIDCHIYENLDEDGEPLMWKEFEKDTDVHRNPLKISDAKENSDSVPTSEFPLKKKAETIQDSSMDTVSHTSSVDNNLNSKANLPAPVNNSSKNSESSYSRNSILSQQSNEDSIPFIDDDDVLVRPNCGRAYLDIPSCDSISKLMNCFDPFVDRLSIGTEDSSPEGDVTNTKLKDFQLSSSKTLDKNSKISHFNYSGSKYSDNKSDIVVISENNKKSSAYSNRESYPPSNENSQKNIPCTDKKIEDSTEDLKVGKKIGKATVVRRPSISKLKALFEKSSVSSPKGPNDVSKRLLFRHNTHHVSRAGSAPPSLDCMDRSSAVERESILKIVTRKFRSSSVRTERELQSKQNDKTVSRKSATDTVKEGLSALTRTVSFSLNKTFKSYSPSKSKPENISSPTTPTDSIIGIYKPKSPDSQKGNSMWYDKSSLARAVAVVKPTGKFDSDSDATISPRSPSDQKSPDRKSQDTHFNYITKPAKLKDFFSSLNKKDAKDATALWYNEIDVEGPKSTEKVIYPSLESDGATSPTKSTSKVLPFLQMPSWKKVSQKSPLSSPDSPKDLNDTPAHQKSKFYTDIMIPNDDALNSTVKTNPEHILPKCPVPEEIIPLNVNTNDTKFWPSNSLKSTASHDINKSEYKTNCNKISEHKCDEEPQTELAKQTELESIKQQASTEMVKTNSSENIKVVQDVPPAIPKKLVIGKNKNPQIPVLNNNAEILSAPSQQTVNSDSSSDDSTEIKPSTSPEKSDHYINVNIKAKKNLEQIENALRKNPRGAIIDLTSRESYSMEEELVNAVKQLSETSDKSKVPTTSSSESLSKSKGKSSSKFPGYEVIWPEDHCPIQKSKSSSKVPLANKTKTLDNFHQNCMQAASCYSPPLRRSVNANLPVSKSQSCSNLDWLEHDEQKEVSNTPTKKLVNEAVVELNTLLNQLTTRTLSEDAGFNSNTKEKIYEESVKIKPKSERVRSIEQNDTVVDSVTLVTKSYNSGSSPKEEEIVFHFPPPPRVPPPKDETPAESFDIVCKGGSLLVKESPKNDAKFDNASKVVKKDKTDVPNKAFQANSSQEDAPQMFPQPAPRKSKQANGLRKSSSYSNIGPSLGNIRYENIFLEKYQTLSKLEIKPEKEHSILDKTVPLQKSPVIPKKSSAKDFNYVNIGNAHFSASSNFHSKKPVGFPAQSESCKNEDSTVNISKIQALQGTSKMIMDKTDSGDSVYGKIYKISDSKGSTREISSDFKNAPLLQDSSDVKKKPVLSKKAERAPLPPNMQRSQMQNNETPLKINTIDNNSMIPKKLPSRKLEKAPPPPHLLQKSSSAMNIPKKNLQGPQPYVNFPATHQIEEKHKLPAVRENVPNDLNSPQKVIKKVNPPAISNKFINRGLSHSQSDVSVFLALKERRMQLANQERKVLNMESMLRNRKTNDPFVNVSSSDSDSSYERIFVVKNEESSKIPSQSKTKEQQDKEIIKSFRKEVPVAPPRSKRRSTTEVQYSKVKAKDASLINTSLLTGKTEKTFQSNTISNEDNPPAIPMKTKDAFEIPEECITRDMNKTTEDKKVITRPSE